MKLVIVITLFLFTSPIYPGQVTVGYFSNKSKTNWDWLSIGISYSIIDGLQFVKNLALVNFNTAYYSLNRSKNKDKFLFGASTNYLIFGEYKINNNSLYIRVKILNIQSKKLVEFRDTGQLKDFSNNLTNITIKIANYILSNINKPYVYLEKKSLLNYRRHNPLNIEFLRQYMRAWDYAMKEDSINTIAYCKRGLLYSPNNLSAILLMAKAHALRSEYIFANKLLKDVFLLSSKWLVRIYLTYASYELGLLYHIRGDYKKAFRLLKKVAKLNNEMGDKLLYGRILNRIAYLYFLKGEHTKARAYYDNALQTFMILDSQKDIAITRRFFAFYYHTRGNYVLASRLLTIALKAHKNNANNIEIINDYILKGNIERATGKYNEAISSYKTALGGTRLLNLRITEGKIYNLMASAYDLLGEKEVAKTMVNKAIKDQKAIHDLKGLAITYNNLGLIYYTSSLYKESLEYYKKSLNINLNLDLKYAIARDYTNIGLVFSSNEEYDKAISYYNKALNLRKTLDDRIGIAITKNSFALLYINKDSNYDKALDIYQQSISDMKKEGYNEGVAISYWMMGIIYEKQGLYTLAINSYISSRDLFLELNHNNYKNLNIAIKQLEHKIKK